jgi:hypothetical protein
MNEEEGGGGRENAQFRKWFYSPQLRQKGGNDPGRRKKERRRSPNKCWHLHCEAEGKYVPSLLFLAKANNALVYLDHFTTAANRVSKVAG